MTFSSLKAFKSRLEKKPSVRSDMVVDNPVMCKGVDWMTSQEFFQLLGSIIDQILSVVK